jgi:hypothetical protein
MMRTPAGLHQASCHVLVRTLVQFMAVSVGLDDDGKAREAAIVRSPWATDMARLIGRLGGTTDFALAKSGDLSSNVASLKVVFREWLGVAPFWFGRTYDKAWSIAFDPNGRCLVSAGRDGTLRSWDWAARGHVDTTIVRFFDDPEHEFGVPLAWDGAFQKQQLPHKGWFGSGRRACRAHRTPMRPSPNSVRWIGHTIRPTTVAVGIRSAGLFLGGR